LAGIDHRGDGDAADSVRHWVWRTVDGAWDY
jgi:hypothetical protein